MSKRKIFFALLVVVFALVVYLLAWPVPINPAVWTPPVAPELTGVYAQNSELARIERLRVDGFAPEDVAIDSQDRIYCGAADGRIFRFQKDGTKPEVFASTKGRPLGLVFDHNGNLIVADAMMGLMSISPDGKGQVLSTEADGVPFRCTNDLDVAADGTIYFTDASYRFPLTQLKADLLEHQPNGRFLAYDPRTKQTRVLLRDLYFANGVAVSPDQSFVLVNDTGSYRVRRYWLSGPKQGQSDIFIDNLPGFPDGISSNGRDMFWLALVNRRDSALDGLMPHPFLRKVVMRLPNFLQPNIKRYAFVLGLDANGRVVRNLQDPSPQCFAQIANVVEHKGVLYFGSIGESAVGRMPLPAPK
ncbi:MAG TPA: SMP-30/gluconolactonase/LRE family protein [Pyrinomonadaceae bacterium]|nr:SMP-30/gluconolactonase/LRE family protein [Pyrinomonadaceae bacterium]